MSYCRWSTDNGKCDIYAYESAQGFVIHVAGNRVVGEPPKCDYDLIIGDNVSHENKTEFINQQNVRSKWVDSYTREDITLPYAGETFTEPDEQSFYNRMVQLREIGYCFPDYVLKIIQAEIDAISPPTETPSNLS